MMVWFRFLPFFLLQTRCILRWTQPWASSRMVFWTLRQSLMTGCSSIQHLQEVQKMEPELRRGVTTSGSMRSQICFLVGDKMIMQKDSRNVYIYIIYIYIQETKTGRKKNLQQSNNPRIDRTTRTVPCRKLRPSDALFVAGAVGVALRCRRSDAAEVEPWSLGCSMWGVWDVLSVILGVFYHWIEMDHANIFLPKIDFKSFVTDFGFSKLDLDPYFVQCVKSVS